MNYYPHHIGDFNNATRYLTRVERALYRDAIELYYDTESVLTLDFDKLCRKLLASTDDEKIALQLVLDDFFTKTDDGYFHDRCNQEIEKYRSNTSNKAKAGIASALARQQKSTPVKQVFNEPITNNQEPVTINHKPISIIKPIRTKVLDSYFEDFWYKYPKKVGKEAALKAWNKMKPDIIQVIDAINWQRESKQWLQEDGKYIPNPATYLNQGRWQDEAPTEQAPF